MADLEQSLEELESVKQSFKANIDNTGISTSSVEFRNMPNLINQMEKKLPTQTKNVTPTESSQSVTADTGYKLTEVKVGAIPNDYVGSSVQKLEETTYIPTTTDIVIDANQYLEGSQIIKGDANLVPQNIAKDVELFGLVGTHEGGIQPSGTIEITENNKTYDVTNYASANVNVPTLEGSPIEVATDTDMINALTQGNLGKVYKFTGTSSTYETGAIYIIEEI